MSIRKIAVGALAIAAIASPVFAQTPPPMPKPGPEHEILKQDVGTWDATVEVFEPGKPPEVSKSVETITMLGGLWAVSVVKSEFMGAPFEGHGVTGWDFSKKKYVSTWVDSMSAGFTMGEATYDAKSRTMTGWMEGPDMSGKMMKMKQVQEWKGSDVRIATMFAVGPDGKEFPMMKITCKRRK